jgi:hypothetical protein
MTDSVSAPAATPAPAGGPSRPDYVPEKFWDTQAGQVRVEALSKSYGELERRMSGMIPGPKSPDWEQNWRRAMGVPASPDGYGITPKDDCVSVDADVNRRQHAAGFTPAQAPLVRDYADGYRAEIAREKLVAEFGGAEKWDALAPQIARWGEANLPRPVYEALASSPAGVRALHRLMSSGEPSLDGMGAAARPVDEEGLRKLMADKRYWRDHDPEIARVVSEGFRRLYPDRDA